LNSSATVPWRTRAAAIAEANLLLADAHTDVQLIAKVKSWLESLNPTVNNPVEDGMPGFASNLQEIVQIDT
jgi:hypothetical protein